MGDSCRLTRQVANSNLQLRRFKRDAARKLAAVEARNAELTRLLFTRELQLAETMSSRSWRITRPLRLIGCALIPIKNKLRIRQRIRRLSLRSAIARYNAYVRAEAKRVSEQSNHISECIKQMAYKPRFSIVIDGRLGTEGLNKTFQSIDLQIYSHWSATVLLGENAMENYGLPNEVPFVVGEIRPFTLDGDVLIFLRCGQRLAPDALYEFASRLNRADSVDMVYADEDQEDASGKRYQPFHKPDWSPDYLETFNYIGFVACFRRSQVLRSLIYKGPYDFVLQFTERSNKVAHIPKILGQKPRTTAECIDTVDEISALEGRLDRTSRKGLVRQTPQHPGCYNIKIDMIQKQRCGREAHGPAPAQHAGRRQQEIRAFHHQRRWQVG